jgi:hypothetical protein
MSLWNIDDNATKDLMLAFMRRLREGAMTEFALREAMLATRQAYADPALWASVALYGLPSKADRPPERRSPRVALPQNRAAPTMPAMVPSGPPQRAVLYEEAPRDSAGHKSMGSVVWGAGVAPAGDRRAAELRGAWL